MKSSMSNRSFYQDVTSRAGSVAASWYTSAMSWFGDWIQPTQTISGRMDGLRVSESLIIELVQQGRILDDKKRQLEREAAAAGGLADYRFFNYLFRIYFYASDNPVFTPSSSIIILLIFAQMYYSRSKSSELLPEFSSFYCLSNLN